MSAGDAFTSELAEQIASKLATQVAVLAARPRYYTAATAPIERRAWNRAVKEITAFKPGRQVMVLADDLHDWIERQRVEPAEPGMPAAAPDPLSYEAFAEGVKRRRSRRAA